MRGVWRYVYTPRELAYPYYPCQLCVGQEEWRGCYCSYHGAYAPGSGAAPWWVRILRKFVKP